VNKVATAVLLRFNVRHASLPEEVRERLIMMLGNKLSNSGDLLIKANRFRNQERNRQDALERLHEWIHRASIPVKKRKATKPTFASKQKHLQHKKIHGKIKLMRSRKLLREE
jgi:ribosome-associated protein